jgi:hypothetical protein
MRTIAVVGAALAVGGAVVPATADEADPAASAASCSPGARTLSHRGDHVYPETGNGGYRSVHTDVHIAYNAVRNRFLRGTHVNLHDVATKCLTEFSLDLERRSAAGADGPDLRVRAVKVDGVAASYRFVRPTYPGDPHGPDDPDPRAHQAGQGARVGGPQHNPLPPACSPQLTGDDPHGQDGQVCPANKLVITPSAPLRAGHAFVVSVAYIGRPGVHLDGDGSTEGWFRSDRPAGDGGFVTTEPVGTEDWMPLNDHPRAKPTYDFYDTVTAGRTAIANGVLVSRRRHAPDARFPQGSTTFHWHMASPVASYLVENSVGHFDLTSHVGRDGIRYYRAQAHGLTAARKRANLAIMRKQEAITAFQSRFNGPFPFASDGVLVGRPDAGFEEEMETMIAFASGKIDLDTFHHENMHQWWGDNVSEANYRFTFFKEGLATLGEFLFRARQAAAKAGGLATARGRAAFERSLVARFDRNYGRKRLFAGAPSDPTPYSLFDTASTYDRPGSAYIALRRILGRGRFASALRDIQRRFGGRTITEAQLERRFAAHLPVRSAACDARLGAFFHQWFDTDYPAASGATRPRITGPGLDGGGFFRGTSCHATA